MNSWIAPTLGLSEQEWIDALRSVTAKQDQSMWQLGDLWAYGEQRYGNRKAITESPDWRGPAFQTCADAAWVAKTFTTSRRREVLSFSHHKEVAHLPAEQADALLDWAENEHKSTRELRERAKAVTGDVVDADKLTVGLVEDFIAKKSLSGSSAKRLRRICKISPDLARDVLAGKYSISCAYDLALERLRERERDLKANRTAKSIVTGNVVPIHSRPVSECAEDLGDSIKLLRRMCDDRYSAETLHRQFDPADAKRIEADLRVTLKFLSNLVKTWERLRHHYHNAQERSE